MKFELLIKLQILKLKAVQSHFQFNTEYPTLENSLALDKLVIPAIANFILALTNGYNTLNKQICCEHKMQLANLKS